MKKIILNIFMAFLFVGCSASTYKYDKTSKVGDSMNLLKQIDYDQGYNQAIKDKKKKWIAMGVIKAKRVIGKYYDRMVRLEAGKYADSKKMLTPSEIFIIKNADGTLTADTLGGKIEKNFNIEEIMKIYSMSSALEHTPIREKNNANYIESSKIPNNKSIVLIGASQYNDSPKIKSSISGGKDVFIPFKKTSSNRKVLNRYGADCNIGEDDYLCKFKNQNDFVSFCEKSNICGVL